MNELLSRFNGDPHTKDALKEYFTLYLESEIVKRARDGKSVESVATAILEVEKAFSKLEEDYGIKDKPTSQTNTAR